MSEKKHGTKAIEYYDPLDIRETETRSNCSGMKLPDYKDAAKKYFENGIKYQDYKKECHLIGLKALSQKEYVNQ